MESVVSYRNLTHANEVQQRKTQSIIDRNAHTTIISLPISLSEFVIKYVKHQEIIIKQKKIEKQLDRNSHK